MEKLAAGNTPTKLITKKKHIVIGVAGGTASGKTSLCDRIGKGLEENICIVSLDSFYRGLR